jgi:hypothetical protein
MKYGARQVKPHYEAISLCAEKQLTFPPNSIVPPDFTASDIAS